MATPAAVLSILVKAQGVQATAGDLGRLDKAGRKAGAGLATTEGHAKRATKTFSVMGTAAKTAGVFVGAAGLAKGLQLAVGEYREAQKTGAQTNAVLKSTGNAGKVTRKHIQDLAGSISKKAGIDDEAIQSGENLLLTFTKIRNEAGKGNQIFDRTTQVITDMSVALGQPMKSSAIQVGKALQDPIKGITALRRVGVNFNAQQSEQIKKMVESGHQLEAQRTILKELTKEFGGSAAAQATAGDKFQVSLRNLAEAAGAVLVPALDSVERFLTRLMDQMVHGVGVGGALISTFRTTGNAIASVVGVIAGLVKGFRDGNTGAVLLGIAVAALTAGFVTYKTIMFVTATATKAMAAAQVLLNIAMTANPIGLVVIGLAALAAAIAIAYVKFETFRNIVNGVFSWLKSNWPLVLGILTGPFGLAVLAIIKYWGQIKSTFTSALAALRGAMSSAASSLASAATGMAKALIGGFRSALNFAHELAVAMRDLITKAPGYALGVGKAIVNGIISGIKAAAGGIGDAIGKAAKGAIPKLPDLNPFGEGLGASAIVPLKGGGNLMGARASMAPFAAVGAANGLRVSSGLRRGAITSSGNTSYHSTGEAVDLAGSPAGMMKTFKTLRSKFGSRLAELIYTPGGAGIKNGKPNVYTGQVAADHFDHVHVAFDTGMPGVGDGYGKGALQSLWTRAGGAKGAANMAAAIALAESGGQSTAAHRNTDGSIDRGLWQINSVHGKQSTFNPMANARAAVSISSSGRNWNPWVTFKTGAYKKFLKGGAAKVTGKAGRSGNKLVGVGKPSFGSKGGLGFSDQQIAEINAQADYNAARQAENGTSGGGEDGGSEVDTGQALIDAIKTQTSAIASLKAAIDAQNAIAGSTLGIGLKEAQRALADMIANQLGSYGGTAGRALTAGSGTVVRY